MKVIAFDIDGTIVHTPEGEVTNYDDPASLAKMTPCPVIIPWLRLTQKGYKLIAITGRGRHVHEFTRQQIKRLGLDDVTVHSMNHHGIFPGYAAMTKYKTDILKHSNEKDTVILYVGDTSWDKEAATKARVLFFYAKDLMEIIKCGENDATTYYKSVQ